MKKTETMNWLRPADVALLHALVLAVAAGIGLGWLMRGPVTLQVVDVRAARHGQLSAPGAVR